MVPLMIETWQKSWRKHPSSSKIVKNQVFGKQFHTICSGGAYLDPSYIDLFKKYGHYHPAGLRHDRMFSGYQHFPAWNIRKDSVGQLVPNCQAKTVDGELWVKGSSVMQGYYKMPEETAETLEGRMAEDRRPGLCGRGRVLYILTGRKKNLIITKNGENVSPEELENALSRTGL